MPADFPAAEGLPPQPPTEDGAARPQPGASADAAGTPAGVPAGPVDGEGLVVGRPELIAAWRAFLLALPAGRPPARSLHIVSRDFAALPLDEAPVLQALTAWLRLPGRSITLLGLRFDAMERVHPRFSRWRRDWLHRIHSLTPATPTEEAWPTVFRCDTAVIRQLEEGVWRARCHGDTPREMHLIEALQQRCEPAWPGTVLGL